MKESCTIINFNSLSEMRPCSWHNNGSAQTDLRPLVMYFETWQSIHSISIIQWNSDNSTSDNSKSCLTQTKFHGTGLGNDNLLGISRTFNHTSNWSTVVSATKLPFLWLDMFTFLCNKLNLSVFLFIWEENLTNLRKFIARKWNTLERNGLAMMVTWLMQRESLTHNSNFS